MTARPDWDTYFLRMAITVAERSTCPRKSVGAVVVDRNQIIATGYNGSLPGLPHCMDVGCIMEHDHCSLAMHAEANALCQAAKRGNSVEGATMYVTALPCWPCFRLLMAAGIAKVVYLEAYRPDERVLATARALKVPLVHGSAELKASPSTELKDGPPTRKGAVVEERK